MGDILKFKKIMKPTGGLANFKSEIFLEITPRLLVPPSTHGGRLKLMVVD